MTSAAVSTPSLREVREGLRDMLLPVATLHSELVESWALDVDATAARRRVKAGRPAFDAIEVLHRAGDLRRPFDRATRAFMRAGLASPESAIVARQQARDVVLALGTSWLAGEPLSRQEPRRLAQRAVAVVVGSVLTRMAAAVRPAVRRAAADRSACPACGSPPEFAVTTAAGRRLVCARCDSQWTTTRPGCVGCGAHDSPTVFRIPSPGIGYDLLVCNACGRYLKERRGRAPSDLLVERTLTAQLDAAAEQRGLHL